ncbi:MAG TPA: alcohol dehydrogenase catalytic domain-containing protein [Motilibacteraceae bacterium]|nr:alcohol dehydrogenase catalytic domain-containing protein [Motilibacteraceae bacterium]
MRALVAHGPGSYAVQEVPEPELPAGGLLVDVEAAGVCAADRMLWTGRHPWGDLPWPFVPGHELLGRVVASDRDDVAVGTRVTAEVKVPCGACAMCRRGRTHLCAGGPHLGSGIPGAFAERLALPAGALVHPVPHGLPREVAVLAEPAACAVHAVQRGGVRPGDDVLVWGLGPVGALAALAARSAGAGRVRVVVRRPAKGGLAASLGLVPVLLDEVGPSPADGADAPDVVLECSGDAGSAVRALDVVAPGGVVVLYSVYTEPVGLDLNVLAEHKGIDLRGGHLAPGAFPAAIALLSDPALSDVLSEIVTEARPLTEFRAALEPSKTPRLKEVLVP